MLTRFRGHWPEEVPDGWDELDMELKMTIYSPGHPCADEFGLLDEGYSAAHEIVILSEGDG